MAKKETKVKTDFIDNGNGTISDPSTGLMWAKKGSENYLNFKEAEKYCKELSLGEHKNWRLPTLKELFALADHTKTSPAIDPIFDCESSWYWTSTEFAGDSDFAWMVGFGGGSTYWDTRSSDYYVRPVRQY